MIHHIFIHGAWHDSKCWDNVINSMKERGGSASAIDLPGHGENKADFADITLNSYIDAVIEEANKYEEVVLIGHSMGGVVISGVVGKISKKVKKLIFISGIIPANNRSLSDRTRTFSQEGIGTEMIFDFEKNKVSLKRGERVRSLLFNDCNREEAEKGEGALQDQPLRPFSDKLHAGKKFNEFPKLYIKCTLDKCILQEDQHKMAIESVCDIVELEAGHSPYISTPEKLSEIIVKNS